MRWLREHLVLLYALLALGYLFVPIGYTVAFSFNAAGRSNLTWQGFTLRNWTNPCGAPEVCTALGNSLKIGLLATLGATLLGTMVAFALARHRFRGQAATILRRRPTRGAACSCAAAIHWSFPVGKTRDSFLRETIEPLPGFLSRATRTGAGRSWSRT